MNSDADTSGAEEPKRDCYAFYRSEQIITGSLIGVIRGILLLRKDVTAHQIALLGKLLFGLERLPRLTPEVSINLTLNYRFNNERSEYTIRLDKDSFRLDSGGYVYDPQVGGDSYGSTAMEVGVGWRGDCLEVYEILVWIDSCGETMSSAEYKINIDYHGEETFDWYIDKNGARGDSWDMVSNNDE